MDKHCFLHGDAVYCDSKCMAYTGKDNRNPKCLILSLGSQFISLVRRAGEPSVNKHHPKSAEPPEVRI